MDEKKTVGENETAELAVDELNAVAGGRGGGHHEPPHMPNPLAGEGDNNGPFGLNQN